MLLRRRAFAGLGLTWAALLLLSPLALAAALDTSHWAYYRQIDTSGQPDGLVRIKLDTAVFAGAASDLADLRIVDGQGQEIPSQVNFQQRSVVQRDRWTGKITVQKKGKPDGSGTSSLEVDLGGVRPADHFYMTADGKDFWKQVTLQGSTDGSTWTPIPGAGYIYDFTSLRAGRAIDFPYPRGAYRYLRATIADNGTPPLTAQTAWATDQQVTTVPVDQVPTLLLQSPPDPQAQDSVVLCDRGVMAPPVHQLTLETSNKDFHRFVRVESSDDGTAWTLAGSGVIYRYDLPTGRSEDLEVSFSTVTRRYLRLTLPNAGAGPLNVTRVDTWSYPRFLEWRLRSDQAYSLYYGGVDVAAPAYPPGSLGIGVVATLPNTALGPQRPNPAFYGTPPGAAAQTPGGLPPPVTTGQKGATAGATGAQPAPSGAAATPAATGSGHLSPAAVTGWSLLGAAGLGGGGLAYRQYARRFLGKGD